MVGADQKPIIKPIYIDTCGYIFRINISNVDRVVLKILLLIPLNVSSLQFLKL